MCIDLCPENILLEETVVSEATAHKESLTKIPVIIQKDAMLDFIIVRTIWAEDTRPYSSCIQCRFLHGNRTPQNGYLCYLHSVDRHNKKRNCFRTCGFSMINFLKSFYLKHTLKMRKIV